MKTINKDNFDLLALQFQWIKITCLADNNLPYHADTIMTTLSLTGETSQVPMIRVVLEMIKKTLQNQIRHTQKDLFFDFTIHFYYIYQLWVHNYIIIVLLYYVVQELYHHKVISFPFLLLQKDLSLRKLKLRVKY